MVEQPPFGISPLLKRFAYKIGCTWFLVAVENALLACIPLLIGFAIDALLAGKIDDLLKLAAVFLLLIAISIARRVFDTRAYGSIRIALGLEVDDYHKKELVSIRNARLNMTRELVDFLEEDVPELFTAVIQLSVAIIVLAIIEPALAYSALVLLVFMASIYAGFHKRFYALNNAINNQVEQQVSILNQNCIKGLKQHLWNLRRQEVRLSDTDAILYGLIFVCICLFILCNLSLSSTLIGVTAGTIFSIVSYSWEFSESAIALPMTMQKLSRLKEISQRLNKQQ